MIEYSMKTQNTCTYNFRYRNRHLQAEFPEDQLLKMTFCLVLMTQFISYYPVPLHPFVPPYTTVDLDIPSILLDQAIFQTNSILSHRPFILEH